MSQRAADVKHMLGSSGWVHVEAWLNKQIVDLRDREEKDGDIDNPRISVLSYGRQMKIASVTVDKGYNKHAIRAFKTLLSKVKDMSEEEEDA